MKKNTDTDIILRVLHDKSDFETIETYKSIRTNIMFSLPKSNKGKIIALTSSAPGEGKTTTSINLAITFAQTGNKVLLIDCDLRKSRVHRYLQIERGTGITNVLCGFSNCDETIRKNVRDNLDVLTSGELPPNPAELLQTDDFASLITELKEIYDYIIIDTPPVTIVTDAIVITKQCDGIVLVIKQDQTVYDMLDETIDAIRKSNTKIIGAIYLKNESKSKKYGYYKSGKYKYKSGYKYGYKYDYRYSDDNE